MSSRQIRKRLRPATVMRATLADRSNLGKSSGSGSPASRRAGSSTSESTAGSAQDRASPYNQPRRMQNFSISTATNTTEDIMKQNASSSASSGSVLKIGLSAGT